MRNQGNYSLVVEYGVRYLTIPMYHMSCVIQGNNYTCKYKVKFSLSLSFSHLLHKARYDKNSSSLSQ